MGHSGTVTLALLHGSRKPRPAPIGVGAASRLWVRQAVHVLSTQVARLWKALIGFFRRRPIVEEVPLGTSPEELILRYDAASLQLSDELATVRLAGVATMSRLADDWPVERQQCIDVLCTYLRAAPRYATGFSESDIRNAIVATITAHLRDESELSWARLDFDFTGAVFYDADFADVTFSGARTSFARANFSGGVTRFARATFSGEVTRFDGATFSGGVARFDGATFSGAYTFFAGAAFAGWDTIFDGARFGGAYTVFDRATFSGWYTNFNLATFSSGYTGFDLVTFSAQKTGFEGASFSGAVTRFDGATFCGKATSFDMARFTGKHTSFEGTTFSGERPADEVTTRSSFDGSEVRWGPISPRPLPTTGVA